MGNLLVTQCQSGFSAIVRRAKLQQQHKENLSPDQLVYQMSPFVISPFARSAYLLDQHSAIDSSFSYFCKRC
ncbi:MAG: hypothetical protein KME15_15330 [Drouetiella hepatica Uher 2000/2452]|uniref:Uncharacterized protein n=1 Tax=Drouetiella hepatica Uher 2000/2452 TaxID=904376 RepID=A0A951QE15_9CYAN|nr:hypothetical protein [Drouetiella hepatica Uher 2000/2452]